MPSEEAIHRPVVNLLSAMPYLRRFNKNLRKRVSLRKESSSSNSNSELSSNEIIGTLVYEKMKTFEENTSHLKDVELQGSVLLKERCLWKGKA